MMTENASLTTGCPSRQRVGGSIRDILAFIRAVSLLKNPKKTAHFLTEGLLRIMGPL